MRVTTGDGIRETGESNKEEDLDTGVIRLLFVGLSGVRNSGRFCSGGQD